MKTIVEYLINSKTKQANQPITDIIKKEIGIHVNKTPLGPRKLKDVFYYGIEKFFAGSFDENGKDYDVYLIKGCKYDNFYQREEDEIKHYMLISKKTGNIGFVMDDESVYTIIENNKIHLVYDAEDINACYPLEEWKKTNIAEFIGEGYAY